MNRWYIIDAYIYLITNTVNGKKYVGKTTHSIAHRFSEHKQDSKTKPNDGRPLLKAMRKYGTDCFIVEQLEKCTDDNASEREIYWIDKLDTYRHGYNATIGGDGRSLVTDEQMNEIVRLFNSGLLYREIARAVGVDEKTVRLRLSDIGLKRDSEDYTKRWSMLKSDKIIMLDRKTGEEIRLFYSVYDIKKFLGLERIDHIREVCNGKRKTAYGYRWKFAENTDIAQ